MKFKYKVLNMYNHSAKKLTYEEFLKLLHLYTDDEDRDKNDEDKGGQHEMSGLHNYTVCLHICSSQAVQMDW